METMRADRLLSELGLFTRSEAKKAIRGGRLKMNGIVVSRPEEKLDPGSGALTLDGTPLEFQKYEYWVLNKPKGLITATEDRKRETVLSHMGLQRKGLSPCGRLDADTEGLLLVTNDGAMIHRLLSPARHVDKTYEVRYEGTLPEDAAERIREGLTLEDGYTCLPAVLEHAGNPAVLTIREGKYHQVKRMFASLGCPVTGLTRIAMGPLRLADLGLSTGEFRRLTGKELALLKQCADSLIPEACIFDLDGTLVDSMWMWKDIDIAYLARFGITCPEDLQEKISGMGFTETAQYFRERFSIPDDIETIKRDWEEMSVDLYRTKVPLKPGVEEFLQRMRERGVRMGIATSNGAAMVDAVLRAQNIREYFDAVVTACEVKAGKPSPDIYLRAAELLKVSPENCLVFEDIPEGILAGKRAGMTVAAVRDDFSRRLEPEKERLSDLMISDYRELL